MAGRIPQEFIDELLQRIDIVDVIDGRVSLKKGGKDFKACCPFHEERTPSFTVSQSKQFYHCFGCGVHGTAISFLMEYAHMEFREAIEELAALAGLSVPEESQDKDHTQRSQRSQSLLQILAEAGRYFQTQLRQHAQSEAAITYLKGRGLNGQIAAEFGLGFAPDAWDSLLKKLGKDEPTSKQLLQAGLITQNERGKTYDRFRSRVIFPIHDHRGRVVAFGGRILGDGEPKYLNSPETPVFHKGSELYGLYKARGAVRDAGKSIVVEGYMDVLALAQYGVNNAVATLGTATSRTHLQRLFRLAPEVVFCFDGDRAGRDAAWRALETAMLEMQDGRQVSFLFLPEGDDPDSIVRKEGADAFGERVASATPLSDFFFSQLSQNIDLSRLDGRARLVELAKPQLSKLQEGAFKSLMLEQLARLSQMQSIQLETTRQTHRFQNQHNKLTPLSASPERETPVARAIAMLLQFPALGENLKQKMSTLEVASEKVNIPGMDLLRQLSVILDENPGLTTASLLERFRETKYHARLEKLAVRDHQLESDQVLTYFEDGLLQLEIFVLTKRNDYLLAASNEGGLMENDAEELKSNNKRLGALLEQRQSRL